MQTTGTTTEPVFSSNVYFQQIIMSQTNHFQNLQRESQIVPVSRQPVVSFYRPRMHADKVNQLRQQETRSSTSNYLVRDSTLSPHAVRFPTLETAASVRFPTLETAATVRFPTLETAARVRFPTLETTKIPDHPIFSMYTQVQSTAVFPHDHVQRFGGSRTFQGVPASGKGKNVGSVNNGKLLEDTIISANGARCTSYGGGQKGGNISGKKINVHDANVHCAANAPTSRCSSLDDGLVGGSCDPHRVCLRTTIERCRAIASQRSWADSKRVVDNVSSWQGCTNHRPVHSFCSGRPPDVSTEKVDVGYRFPLYKIKHAEREMQLQQAPAPCSKPLRPGAAIPAEGRAADDGASRSFIDGNSCFLPPRIGEDAESVLGSRAPPEEQGVGNAQRNQRSVQERLFLPHHLTSKWPSVDKKKAASFDLPLYVKSQPPLNLAKLRNLMDVRVRALFDGEYKYFSECTPLLSVNVGCQRSSSQLSDEDIRVLRSASFIEEISVNQVRGFVSTFSVDETTKGRRRWIVHPQYFNEMYSAIQLPYDLALHSIDQIINDSESGVSYLTDFSAWFHQFEIHQAARPFFCFKHGDKLFACTRIPMGATVCPNIGHLASIAIARAVTNVHTTVYIDNIRFTSRTPCGILEKFRSTCKEIGAGVGECNGPLQEYDFLGVHFKPVGGSLMVSAATSFIDKLFPCASSIDDPDATIRDILRLFGKLMYGSRILSLKCAKYYYAFKFLRRRCGIDLDNLAVLWPSSKQSWRTWLDEVQSNPPRCSQVPTASRMSSLFTDASMSGYGAFAIRSDSSCVALAGEWAPQEQHRHINELEARAVELALSNLDLDQNIVVFIDNTSAGYALAKGRSKNFIMNFVAKRIREKNYIIHDFIFIKSEDNPADPFSRIYESC